MIRLSDSTRLAFTKLRTRKIRLSITIVLSCLLFALLLAGSFVMRGAIQGMERFSSSGFGSRFLVAGTPLNTGFDMLTDSTLVRQAQAQQKQDQTAKAAAAKRLGIPYDAKADQPYVVDGGPNGNQKQLNLTVPAVQRLMAAAVGKQPGTPADFAVTVGRYGAMATYQSVFLPSGGPGQGAVSVLKNGQETFATAGQSNGQGSGLESLGSQWQLMSGELLRPFILPGQSLAAGKDGSLPVIAPFSAAEQLLKLKPLTASASASDRLERLRTVRQRAAGLRIDVCYRNTTSGQTISEAQSQQAEIKQHQGDKNYQQPDRITALPTQACGPVAVKRDVRTAEAKQLDSKQQQLERMFGLPAADSGIVHLRLAGLNADAPTTSSSASIIGIFSSVLQSNVGLGWFTPLEAGQTNHTVMAAFNQHTLTSAFNSAAYYAELSSAAAAQRLLAEQNCEPDYNAGSAGDNGLLAHCNQVKKYFTLAPYGSSSTGLADLKHFFGKAFLIAAGGVAVFASLIMMGTVGRIIADGRRETAVFRAIGAKRSDIIQIYVTYALLLGAIVAALATALALIAAQVVQALYATGLTVNALVAFNVADDTQAIRLTSFDLRDVILVWGLIALAALLAALVPLLTNVRRNPIRDMRDE